MVSILAPLNISTSTQSISTNSNDREIWLAPFAPVSRPFDDRRGADDYFNLFDPGAMWSSKATKISVFKLYLAQVNLMSDAQLRKIIEGLSVRHIALAIEANVLVATSVCAPNVGKATPILPVIVRLKRLGADLDYIAMNEPLVGGHALHSANDCGASIAAVAQDVANNLKPVLDLYPSVKIGDIEPIGELPGVNTSPAWPTEIGKWMTEYRKAMGRPLDFIHADTVWGRTWKADLKGLFVLARSRNIRFGVLYDGNLSELSDLDWARDTEHYSELAENIIGGRPDDVVFQTWTKWPQHTLPETDPTTLTGIVRAYLRSRTRLSIMDDRLVRLIDEHGGPVRKAMLEVDVSDPRPGSTMSSQSLAGEVPRTATSVLLALRANAECQCVPSKVKISLAGFSYQGRAVDVRGSQASWVWDPYEWAARRPDVFHIATDQYPVRLDLDMRETQSLVLNSLPFPVIGGTPFQGRWTWQVNLASEGEGSIDLIFLDRDGKEIHRIGREFEPTWRAVGLVATNSKGEAALPHSLFEQYSRQNISILFRGDVSRKPTRLTLD